MTGVSSETKIIVIIATVVLPPIGIIMGIVYMNSADPGKKAAGRIWLLVGVGVAIVYCILSGLLSSITQST
jgi:thiol:disulfide interchange protein